MELEEDPRVSGDICGVTELRGQTEFICVKRPHAKIYIRRSSSRTHKRGDPKFSENPSVDKHYFINRWPNRKRES